MFQRAGFPSFFGVACPINGVSVCDTPFNVNYSGNSGRTLNQPIDPTITSTAVLPVLLRIVGKD